MKLTSVIFHSDETQEDVELSVQELSSRSRYTVRSIVGIDAAELIPKFYRAATVSRRKYYEVTMRPRDIVVRVVLNPRYEVNESVSEIRDRLYRLISSNRTGTLQLQFRTGPATLAAINGQITKLEVAHFAKTPEVQITVNCPDPVFRSLLPIDYAPDSFPAANPVSLPDSSSTAPHGLTFAVEITGPHATFTIQDDPTTPEWQFRVSPTGGFLAGDELYFSSEYAKKELYMIRSSVKTHLMDKVVAGSVWPQVFPGNTKLHFNSLASMDWLSLSYYSAYWGL